MKNIAIITNSMRAFQLEIGEKTLCGWKRKSDNGRQVEMVHSSGEIRLVAVRSIEDAQGYVFSEIKKKIDYSLPNVPDVHEIEEYIIEKQTQPA